jgi:hypothetical protein
MVQQARKLSMPDYALELVPALLYNYNSNKRAGGGGGTVTHHHQSSHSKVQTLTTARSLPRASDDAALHRGAIHIVPEPRREQTHITRRLLEFFGVPLVALAATMLWVGLVPMGSVADFDDDSGSSDGGSSFGAFFRAHWFFLCVWNPVFSMAGFWWTWVHLLEFFEFPATGKLSAAFAALLYAAMLGFDVTIYFAFGFFPLSNLAIVSMLATAMIVTFFAWSPRLLIVRSRVYRARAAAYFKGLLFGLPAWMTVSGYVIVFDRISSGVGQLSFSLAFQLLIALLRVIIAKVYARYARMQILVPYYWLTLSFNLFLLLVYVTVRGVVTRILFVALQLAGNMLWVLLMSDAGYRFRTRTCCCARPQHRVPAAWAPFVHQRFAHIPDRALSDALSDSSSSSSSSYRMMQEEQQQQQQQMCGMGTEQHKFYYRTMLARQCFASIWCQVLSCLFYVGISEACRVGVNRRLTPFHYYADDVVTSTFWNVVATLVVVLTQGVLIMRYIKARYAIDAPKQLMVIIRSRRLSFALVPLVTFVQTLMILLRPYRIWGTLYDVVKG